MQTLCSLFAFCLHYKCQGNANLNTGQHTLMSVFLHLELIAKEGNE